MSAAGLLGACLRTLRAERGLSIQHVSAGAPIAVGFLSKIENGTANPSMDTLDKLAAFFGVPVARLFGGDAGGLHPAAVRIAVQVDEALRQERKTLADAR